MLIAILYLGQSKENVVVEARYLHGHAIARKRLEKFVTAPTIRETDTRGST
jgi:hypothetical protein